MKSLTCSWRMFTEICISLVSLTYMIHISTVVFDSSLFSVRIWMISLYYITILAQCYASAVLAIAPLSVSRPFNGLWSGTTRVGRYQKKHLPTHTHPDHRASFIIFLHLLLILQLKKIKIGEYLAKKVTGKQVVVSCPLCPIEWHQHQWPWMTLNVNRLWQASLNGIFVPTRFALT